MSAYSLAPGRETETELELHGRRVGFDVVALRGADVANPPGVPGEEDGQYFADESRSVATRSERRVADAAGLGEYVVLRLARQPECADPRVDVDPGSEQARNRLGVEEQAAPDRGVRVQGDDVFEALCGDDAVGCGAHELAGVMPRVVVTVNPHADELHARVTGEAADDLRSHPARVALCNSNHRGTTGSCEFVGVESVEPVRRR